MADHSDHDHPDDGGVHVHIHHWKFYAAILGALLFLTVLTVAVSYVDLDGMFALGREVEGVGMWNLGVAMLIASMKATLVILFFMHLKEDKRFNALFFLGSLIFVGVFFAYTANDVLQRGQRSDPYNGVQIDPDTGMRAPGGITGPISGEVLEEGLVRAEPDGAALFARICSACHTIGGGTLVGPDLAGVTQRRTEEWLIPFITSSSTVIASGDETAVGLFAEFNELAMPDVAYSPDEIRIVLAYIETEGGGAAEEPGEDVEDIVEEILGDDFGDEVDGIEEEGGGDDFIDDILGDDGADDEPETLDLPPEDAQDPEAE